MIIQMVLAKQLPPVSATAETDVVLARQAKEDLAAFTDLYQLHRDRVYRYLLVRVSNVQDAQDLTSQTFIAAMENIRQFRGTSPFAAWLLGIARYKAADHLRRKRPEVTLAAADQISDPQNMDEIVGRQIQIEQVARKLQVLSPDRAEALSLRFFGGLEAVEIAKILDKSEASVRMLVYRGLHDLQAQLNDDVEVMS